ncbi:unnamed protein product [Sphenostylis stenocarpa]|uniref:Uncharacterized protein n=1 Tax=Sphenostylis stenocarpa TaxID=92480 RepID=A0AA86SG99_9FABA|nr:unnamed protein product [Sphenostylis stenocarpa]
MEDDATMPQEDQRNCDGRGIGGLGRSSKKSKQKKVPQRGLGVAQLEKIRLEEQQKRDAPQLLPSPTAVPSTYLPHPLQNFHDSNQSPSTTLLPCEPPSEFRSPLSLQQQHMDDKIPNTVPLANNGGFEAGWPVVPGHGNAPNWWNSYPFDSEKSNFRVDPGLPILPCLPLPNLVQRPPQYQDQSSSSVVNVSSGTSSTSMPHFTTEPPSNQNNKGSSVPGRPMDKVSYAIYSHLVTWIRRGWTSRYHQLAASSTLMLLHAHKMSVLSIWQIHWTLSKVETVGTKRPYPFSQNVSNAPAFNYNVPPCAERRTNVKISCGNGSGFNFDAGNSSSREVTFAAASNSESSSKKRSEENENFNGDFLSLAPPSPASYPPSKSKSSSTFLPFHNQGNVEDQIPASPVYNMFNQQKQPLYGLFLPEPKEEQNGHTAARIQNGHEQCLSALMKPNSSGMPLGIEAMHLFVFFFSCCFLSWLLSAWLDESGTGVVTNLCMWVVKTFDCALFSVLFPSACQLRLNLD